MQHWTALRKLLKQSGRESIIHRVKTFDNSTVDPSLARHVMSILEPYDQAAVSIASAVAGSLYVWVCTYVFI